MRIINTILDIVFPVNCLSCGKSGKELCFDCIGSFPPAERESAKWIFPLYDYRHPPIKKSVWLLKYQGKRRLAKIFAEMIYERTNEELADIVPLENFREPILIPIPLSKKRQKERGFNQAELICKEIIKLNKTQLAKVGPSQVLQLEKNILIKPKETEHQARIENRAQRIKNIIGSFTVRRPEFVKGRNIILIDDVTTTGATLSEAKKVLKNAGAKKVIAFTIAH